MTFEADFVTWVTSPHTCDNCGAVKVRETIAGKDRPVHVRMFYTVFVCPAQCNSSIGQEVRAS